MTAIFPTAYSTLSAPALASYIGPRYGFPDVHCTFLVRGVGDTYLLESTTGKYILRLYRPSHRSRPQIQAEVELLLAAKDAGVSVSYPLPDRQGRYIHTFPAAEGQRHGVIFSYAKGNSVSILNESQLQLLGRIMAQFHNLSSAISLSDPRWSFDTATTLTKPLERLRPWFATLPAEYDWWQQAAAATIARLNKLDTTAFSTGFCHFDLLPKNFHFDGDTLTLFDFDFFGHGWLIHDLMTFYVHLSLDAHWGRLTREAADRSFQSVLTAYCSQRPLSEPEITAIPLLSLGFWCFYMDFHTTHDQFYPLTTPAQLQSRTALIRQLTEAYSLSG